MRSALVALAVFGLSAALVGPAAAAPSPRSGTSAKASSQPKSSASPERSAAAKPGKSKERKAQASPKPKKQAKKQARRATSGKKKTAARLVVPKGYTAMVRGWHDRPDEPMARTPDGRPMLVLENVNSKERIELHPQRDDGGFSASELEKAARLLGDRRTGAVFPIDPRLLDLVYRIGSHFEAPLIRVVSGYRMPRPGSHSNHGHGRAIDIVVPGASDEEVASFARALGFVGVGIYPRSGFVHIDTRPKSYFWIDRSGPGRRNRTVGILKKQAAEADAKALARGERPPLPFAAPGHDCTAVEPNLLEQANYDELDDTEAGE